MSTEQTDWPAGRIFHLSGGVRAVNVDGPEIEFQPQTVNGQICRARGKSFASTFGDLRKMGFPVIGVDTYAHTFEIEGKAPPDWRVFRRGWPSWEQGQKWAEIANAGFQAKNGYAWDLASRISQQFRICSWRVRQASEAYADQLQGRSKLGEIKAGQRFEDGFTRLAYIAIQSSLIDACILRDNLAEFAAGFVWSAPSASTDQVASIAGLLKRILPRIPRPDGLADQIEAATKSGGWLELLGHYRDLIVHTAPLATAGASLFAVMEHRALPGEQAMPAVRLTCAYEYVME